MNFPEQDPHPFTKAGIEWLAPNQDGCYGIFNDSECVYIGQGDLRTRLLAHLNGSGGNPCILTRRPTYYLAMKSGAMDAHEVALIASYRPKCNKTAGG